MQTAKRGLYNIIYGVLGQVITICLGIVIPRLVLVSYGSEINGLLNSATQIFAYFSLFEAGVGVASLQALYAPVATGRRGEINAIMAATHRFYIKAGILYAAAVVILSFAYSFFVRTDISYWIVVAVILFGGIGNCLNFLYQGKYKILMQADGKTYVATNITTIFNILVNVAKAVLLLLGFHVIAVQLSYFLVTIVQMLIYYIYVHRNYQWVDLKVIPNHHAIAQKNATLVHQISAMIFNNTDVLFLTLILQNLKIVSVYTMYNTVITMVTALISQMSTGFDFRLGQIYNTDQQQYFKLHHVFEILYMIIAFSAMTVTYIFIAPFMRLYTAGVGDINYLNSWYPLLFVLAPVFIYSRVSANNLINYAGHFKKTQWRAILESIINIGVSVIGIYRFGICGALLGTIVASLYRTNDMILYVYHHLLPKTDRPWKTYKRWIVNFLIFGCFVFFVNRENFERYDSYLHMIPYALGYGILCLALYAAAQALINPAERKTFFECLKPYLNKLLKRNGGES